MSLGSEIRSEIATESAMWDFDELPAPDTCNICGGSVRLVNNETIYGKPYGKYPYVYYCSACGAYVGVHPDNSPLGILADKEMRELRSRCHELFDKTWKNKTQRTINYGKLAMKLRVRKAHFAWMSKEELRKAIKILEAKNDKNTERT
jgi:hypothetical protein